MGDGSRPALPPSAGSPRPPGQKKPNACLPPSLRAGLARPVAGELPGHAAAAGAALERPLQRRPLRCLGAGAGRLEMLEPDADDLEVLLLVERVERDPQPEALGQRHLFFRGLAR